MEDLLTDLERKLVGRTGEALRHTLREHISSAETRLHKRIAAGMAPDAFAQSQACVVALKTASDLLGTLVVPADKDAHPLMSPLLQPAHLPAVRPVLQLASNTALEAALQP